MYENKQDFEKLIMETVDKELKRIFGEATTRIVYGYLEDSISPKREGIAEKIELICKGLKNFFGPGARTLERTILTDLYSKFGFNYKTKRGYSFVDYVTELKNKLSTSKQRILKLSPSAK